jgi:hypothetical protein
LQTFLILKSPRKEDTCDNFDPVKWWSEKQNKSPVLRKIAKDYLAIIVTSAPLERTFSHGGLTSGVASYKKRGCLPLQTKIKKYTLGILAFKNIKNPLCLAGFRSKTKNN